MGNSSNKTYHRSRRKYASQYSLSDMIGGSCSGGRETIREQYNVPRSRAFRRSRSIGQLGDHFGSSKTVWPVSRSEASFLPEFRVRDDPARADYKILELIACGAYGRVYKVQRGLDDKFYALKMIGKAKIIEEDGIEQVKREVSIQEMVGHHPFVARILEHWQGRKTLYITMDYYGGGALFSLVQNYGRLPESVVRIHIGEIGLALDFLHNAGIVHRDVKATNVLLDGQGHAILIDFGLAKRLPPDQRTWTFCGTPEYMAPEILAREHYGHSIDWWSLGVLACFALTNQYPHVPSSEEETTDSRIGGSSSQGNGKGRDERSARLVLPCTDEISSEACDLLRRLLEANPRSRIRSIFGLQRIAFYMGHDIRGYIAKEISPLKLLDREIVSPIDRLSSTTARNIPRAFDAIR